MSPAAENEYALGIVTVLTLTPVTWPAPFLLTTSITSNVPPYAGEAVEVVLLCDIVAWLIVTVSVALTTVLMYVTSPSILKVFPLVIG